MRIGISAQGPSLDSKIAERFGTSEYLLIFDSETGKFEAIRNPGASSLSHSGIQAVIAVISKKPDVLLTGYLSPTAEKHLTANGIRVVRGTNGSAHEAIEMFMQILIKKNTVSGNAPTPALEIHRNHTFIHSLESSLRQFLGALPVIMSVILLLGLLQTFPDKGFIASFFSGSELWSTLKGAIAGSIFAGNPITSYIIGGEILAQGGSLLSVTAFLVAWVTVGLVQLPAEMDALGTRFALIRNGLTFISSLLIAGVTVAAYRYILGWYS